MTGVSDAWQAALGAEQQAVFGYGLLGPRLTVTTQIRLARTCQLAHQELASVTVTATAEVGVDPREPEPDYPALYPVPDARAARRLAVRLEQEAATAWRFLYAVAASRTDMVSARARSAAQSALTASAVRATRWRLADGTAPATVPFPGI